MTSSTLRGLFLTALLGLCLPGRAQADSELTPEWIAYFVLAEQPRCPIVKAKCTSISKEARPEGSVWVGKFVIQHDVDGPKRPKFVEQEGKFKEVWEREKYAVKGAEIDAFCQIPDMPTPKPGDEIVLLYRPKSEAWLVLGLTVGQFEVISKAPAGKEWLRYWLAYRNSEDAVLKAMARLCLANSSPFHCLWAAETIPVAELRESFDHAALEERGPYAVMLGARGDAATDRLRFEETIKEAFASKESYLPFEQLFIGYLQLEPVEAIKMLEHELKTPPKRLGDSMLLALQLSLQWPDSKLPRGEGLRVLHEMLDDPEFNYRVVGALERLNDWTQASKLAQLWDQQPKIRREIVTYLLSAESKGSPSESKQSKEVLSSLRARDAAGVEQATAAAEKARATRESYLQSLD
jgi:hypothetical protein